MEAETFMLEETGRVNRYLRRFTYGQEAECSGQPEEGMGHDAWELMDQVEDPFHGLDPEEKREAAEDAAENENRELLQRGVRGDLWPHDDERWPEECELCGTPFGPDDEWMIYQRDLWTPVDPELREEMGELELADAPPGAMWDAYWLPHESEKDGRCLVVQTPDGWEWVIDGPATNGGGWERKGKPPGITVSPSIGTPGYHGFLIDGEFTEDLEGRTYD